MLWVLARSFLILQYLVTRSGTWLKKWELNCIDLEKINFTGAGKSSVPDIVDHTPGLYKIFQHLPLTSFTVNMEQVYPGTNTPVIQGFVIRERKKRPYLSYFVTF